MLKNALCLLSVVSCLGFVSCSSTGGVDLPKGTSKGYTSARLPVLDPNYTVPTTAREDQVHKMIQNSLKANFKANGMGFGQSSEPAVEKTLLLVSPPAKRSPAWY